MQEHYTPKGKHLTIDNRRLIERWKNENKSNREIAGLLGKAPQTIHNEVKRGTTLQQVRKGLYKKVYSADYAQTVYQFNRKRSVKKLILTNESVNQALTLLLGEHRILSITADNGSEFKRLSEVFPEEHIYYAHAYSSWERGSNENHNRLIRRWLPKGTKKTTPKEVAFIENWINNYPKKCLDYKSPSEFLLGG
ncbi:transposase-like protein, IS1239 [Streptococcus pneumoniae]|nr:IS30 family transposase [Streptococcus pneumoniae]VQS71953.1 transposase-like protein, IS1239 [Streptococcus pneumoniae]VQT07281.1 transposase-like protein, IS1239 [Streptococcus pneumoniae]VRJ35223.1 transposase-like protein, IS1239 [Streptococcus pneumoniae]